MPTLLSIPSFVSRLLRRVAPTDPAAAILDRPVLDQQAIRSLFLRGLQDRQRDQTREVAGNQAGDARSPRRGQGIDYEESRAYQAGDEPRFMNWRLSARVGSLQMKLFREERRPGTVLLIDRRAGMRFGTRSRLKLTQALRLATTIAAAAYQTHASVSMLLLDVQLLWQEPQTGEDGILQLLNTAAVAAPPLDAGSTQAGLDDALALLQQKLQAGSTLWLLSDFTGLSERHRSLLMELGSRVNVHALLIDDPVEHELPTAGPLQFTTAGGSITLDSTDPAVRGQYAALAEAYFSERQTLLTAAGIDWQRCSTTDERLDPWPATR